jgi:hypothetical protein
LRNGFVVDRTLENFPRRSAYGREPRREQPLQLQNTRSGVTLY